MQRFVLPDVFTANAFGQTNACVMMASEATRAKTQSVNARTGCASIPTFATVMQGGLGTTVPLSVFTESGWGQMRPVNVSTGGPAQSASRRSAIRPRASTVAVMRRITANALLDGLELTAQRVRKNMYSALHGLCFNSRLFLVCVQTLFHSMLLKS